MGLRRRLLTIAGNCSLFEKNMNRRYQQLSLPLITTVCDEQFEQIVYTVYIGGGAVGY